MKSGELAARLRTNAEAVKRHKAFTREWKDAVAIQRSALFTHLPLILAALDVAEVERAIKNMRITDDAFFALCDTRIAAYEALRRAEED